MLNWLVVEKPGSSGAECFSETWSICWLHVKQEVQSMLSVFLQAEQNG